MTEVVSKCFKCDLVFKNENLAALHKDIHNHNITKVRAQMIQSY